MVYTNLVLFSQILLITFHLSVAGLGEVFMGTLVTFRMGAADALTLAKSSILSLPNTT